MSDKKVTVRAKSELRVGVHTWKLKFGNVVRGNLRVGVAMDSAGKSNGLGGDIYGWALRDDGRIFEASKTREEPDMAFSSGDTIIMQLDCESGTLHVGKDADSLQFVCRGLKGKTLSPAFSFGTKNLSLVWSFVGGPDESMKVESVPKIRDMMCAVTRMNAVMVAQQVMKQSPSSGCVLPWTDIVDVLLPSTVRAANIDIKSSSQGEEIAPWLFAAMADGTRLPSLAARMHSIDADVGDKHSSATPLIDGDGSLSAWLSKMEEYDSDEPIPTPKIVPLKFTTDHMLNGVSVDSTGKIATSTSSSKSYCATDIGFSSGVSWWEFNLKKDSNGNGVLHVVSSMAYVCVRVCGVCVVWCVCVCVRIS